MAGGRFDFELDGTVILSNKRNDLTVDSSSGTPYCHFFKANGEAIFKKQNVQLSDITLVEDDGTTTHTVSTVNALFAQLEALGYFDWFGSGGSGGGTPTRFDALLDAFSYPGNDGKVPVVHEDELKLVPTEFYNKHLLTEFDDVSVSPLSSTMDGLVLGVGIVSGEAKIVLKNPVVGSGVVDVATEIYLYTSGAQTFTLPDGAKVLGVDYNNVPTNPPNTAGIDNDWSQSGTTLTIESTITAVSGDAFKVTMIKP
jgi:hypothetical protein